MNWWSLQLTGLTPAACGLLAAEASLTCSEKRCWLLLLLTSVGLLHAALFRCLLSFFLFTRGSSLEASMYHLENSYLQRIKLYAKIGKQRLPSSGIIMNGDGKCRYYSCHRSRGVVRANWLGPEVGECLPLVLFSSNETGCFKLQWHWHLCYY